MQENKAVKKNAKKPFSYGWKKQTPKIGKNCAELRTKVIVKKVGTKDTTSVIVNDKDNPFLGKKVGDVVSIKGVRYSLVAIRPILNYRKTK